MFEHLNGSDESYTIQFDEGVFLYSLIRVCGMSRIMGFHRINLWTNTLKNRMGLTMCKMLEN